MLTVVIGMLGLGSYAIAGGGSKNFKGKNMNGYEENMDVSTVASGSFEAELSDDGTKLAYELSYSGLEGTVTQASHPLREGRDQRRHLDLALRDGDEPDPNPLADTPTCPQSGTVTGEADMTDVIGPNAQGIAPGEFAEILAAMRAGHAYANVHSSKFGGGEIRAQINDNKRGND